MIRWCNTVNSEINVMFLLRLDWHPKNKNSHFESMYIYNCMLDTLKLQNLESHCLCPVKNRNSKHNNFFLSVLLMLQVKYRICYIHHFLHSTKNQKGGFLLFRLQRQRFSASFNHNKFLYPANEKLQGI